MCVCVFFFFFFFSLILVSNSYNMNSKNSNNQFHIEPVCCMAGGRDSQCFKSAKVATVVGNERTWP